jgi:hypothetical protein
LAWLVGCLLLAGVAPASADWYAMPFLGLTFGGGTDLVDLERASGDTKVTFGTAAAGISRAGLGIEADIGYSPGFFQKGNLRLVASSSVFTMMGNVVVAAPERITRYTLRPYVSGGLGLMRVHIEDVLDIFPLDARLLGMNVGGGAVGFFTDRTGIRWDLRYFRNLTSPDETSGFGSRSEKLSYWRGSVAVVLKY